MGNFDGHNARVLGARVSGPVDFRRGAVMECATAESDLWTALLGLDQLEAHVQCRVAGHVRELHLDWCDGGIVLRGQSHTYYAKQLAQQAVMTACNLPIRANEIEVR
jgi:hypothetical protein